MKRHEFEQITKDIAKRAENEPIGWIIAILAEASPFSFSNYEWLKPGSDILVLRVSGKAPLYVPVEKVVALTTDS